jgi:hypothetical protein
MKDAVAAISPGIDDRIIPADMFKLIAWILTKSSTQKRMFRSDKLLL